MSKSLGRPLRLAPADVVRFRARVVQTAACDIWTGAVGSDGYGRFAINNARDGARVIGPHLVGARLGFGPIRAGSTVLHDCDVRVCVSTRPGHVRVGTQAENMAQAVQRGRARGPHPGAVDVRGTRGASVAVQDAIGAAVAAGVTDLAELARVLSDTIAQGDPYRQLVPLFDEPDHQLTAAWDDWPVDLFDPRAATTTPAVLAVESLPLF